MKKTSGLILAATAATLFAAVPVATTAQAAEGTVQCMGANACKGQSACKTAENACKGLNACKGHGFTMTSSKQECLDAGGKPAS